MDLSPRNLWDTFHKICLKKEPKENFWQEQTKRVEVIESYLEWKNEIFFFFFLTAI